MDQDVAMDKADVYSVQQMYMAFGFKFFDRTAELARCRDDPENVIAISRMHYAISKSTPQSSRKGYRNFLEDYTLQNGQDVTG